MTTNQTIDGVPRQMISVPLDTLKCYLGGDGGDWVEAGHELRDLLDAPCPPAKCNCAPLCYLSDSSCPVHGKPAAQPHGQPVYQVCNGIDGWIDVDLLRYTACSFDPEEYEVRTLYGEQPAPVAVPRLEMAHVVRAHMEIPGCPVLTSNQCHALAMKLNESLKPSL